MQAHADNPSDSIAGRAGRSAYFISRLRLADFRNYAALALDLGRAPVALIGPNGAGKTNLLEAVSLLVPGRGLRGAPFEELARDGGSGGWAVFACVEGPSGPAEIGTGLAAGADGARTGREVRLGGERAGSVNELAAHCRMVWLTPAMDQLFAGPAGERRRFLDRLVLAVDPAHRSRITAFENAMRQRNALLAEGRGDARWLDGLEAQMAEHGTAVAAARRDSVRLLQGALEQRVSGPFPQARLALEGEIEEDLAELAAVDAEDRYRERLARSRGPDAAAKRTLAGPHRSDLVVFHGTTDRPARSCSTGEQKILLIGIVLAHARLVQGLTGGATPLVLLDEVAAHLDARHRAALFAEIAELGAQAWMSGTDEALFDACPFVAQRYRVAEGRLERLG